MLDSILIFGVIIGNVGVCWGILLLLFCLVLIGLFWMCLLLVLFWGGGVSVLNWGGLGLVEVLFFCLVIWLLRMVVLIWFFLCLILVLWLLSSFIWVFFCWRVFWFLVKSFFRFLIIFFWVCRFFVIVFLVLVRFLSNLFRWVVWSGSVVVCVVVGLESFLYFVWVLLRVIFMGVVFLVMVWCWVINGMSLEGVGGFDEWKLELLKVLLLLVGCDLLSFRIIMC